MSNLCQKCQYPEISLLLALIKKYVDKNQLNLYAILWKNLTFMKFCGDHYDIIYVHKQYIMGNFT